MSYFYSAKTNSFYPLSLKADYENGIGWPDDAVEVSMTVFTEFSETPPDGKARVAGVDGYPAWGDIPLPTAEQQRAMALQLRTALIDEASRVIAPLADAQTGGYIDDTDIPVLLAWQKYRYALTKVAPANPVWPDKPLA